MTTEQFNFNESIFIKIPKQFIYEYNKHIDLPEKLILVLCYFYFYSGINRLLCTSVKDIMIHFGIRFDKNNNTDSYIKAIQFLIQHGIINIVDGDINNHTKNFTSYFDTDKYESLCDGKLFAKVYFDEYLKILNYKFEKTARTINAANTIRLFSFLRLKIIIRRSVIGFEDINIDQHIKDNPEAYFAYYIEIGNILNYTPRTVSKIVNILSDLKIIYFEHYRKEYKNNDGSSGWVTLPTFFSNYYKRYKDGRCLYGYEYAHKEIKSKFENKFIVGYKYTKTNCAEENKETDTTWNYV